MIVGQVAFFSEVKSHRCNRWLFPISCWRMSDISPQEDDRLLEHRGSEWIRRDKNKKDGRSHSVIRKQCSVTQLSNIFHVKSEIKTN